MSHLTSIHIYIRGGRPDGVVFNPNTQPLRVIIHEVEADVHSYHDSDPGRFDPPQPGALQCPSMKTEISPSPHQPLLFKT